MQKKLWVITGPTASGKTDFAIQKALELGCPILSADSRQVYKELNIGVAKPTQAQLNTVQHFFINHISIQYDYNTGIYAKECRHLINQLFSYYNNLIICGGTGLYLQAVINGIDSQPQKNDALRAELNSIIEKNGIGKLQEMLQTLSKEKYDNTEIQNPQLLMRAIEIEKSVSKETTELPDFAYSFAIEKVIIEKERTVLYDRINHRVDMMIAEGLEDEAKLFYDLRHLNALQTVGYVEWWPYFEGTISKTEVIEKIKQHTRNYAKRQVTWIKNRGGLLKSFIKI